MTTAAWTRDELARIGDAEEVEIAPLRRGGTAGNRVTVWLVRHGDALYIRSAVKGRHAAWYRAAVAMHEGRIWAGGIDKDIAFVDVDHGIDGEVDAAYRSKYRRYAGRILNSCLTPEARATTLRVDPQGAEMQ